VGARCSAGVWRFVLENARSPDLGRACYGVEKLPERFERRVFVCSGLSDPVEDVRVAVDFKTARSSYKMTTDLL
jgi:hypothetical protein